MRIIYLIITVALIWLLVDTYMEHTFKPMTTPQGPMERAGVLDTGMETQGAAPVYNREIQKARGVKDILQQDADRTAKELDKQLQN